LSDSAREALESTGATGADVLTDSDFGSTYADVSLAHAFAIGEPKSGDAARVAIAFGGLWSGGDFYARYSRVEAERSWRLSPDRALSLSGSVSLRDLDSSDSEDSVTYGLRAAFKRKLANGDGMTVSLGVAESQSDGFRQDYTSVNLRTAYSFGRRIGPAKVATALEYSMTDYDNYEIRLPTSTSGVFVTRTGPRDDRGLSASLNMVFEDYDYAGFAPEVTVRASRRTSNISRFDSTQLSVSFGIQSKF
jgi:hypothetical protein